MSWRKSVATSGCCGGRDRAGADRLRLATLPAAGATGSVFEDDTRLALTATLRKILVADPPYFDLTKRALKSNPGPGNNTVFVLEGIPRCPFVADERTRVTCVDTHARTHTYVILDTRTGGITGCFQFVVVR